MKFMTMTIMPAEKAAEVAAASDKAWATQPPERRPKSAYVLMTVPFEVPPHSMVSVYITEEDSIDAVAARAYPVMLTGATVNIIPLMELPVGGAAKTEKKLRG
jgi:hypothetical protein